MTGRESASRRDANSLPSILEMEFDLWVDAPKNGQQLFRLFAFIPGTIEGCCSPLAPGLLAEKPLLVTH